MIDWLLESAVHVQADGLLHPCEQEQYAALKTAKRRADWLLGRWTAKRLAQRVIQHQYGQTLPLDTLVIVRDTRNAPLLRDYPQFSLSISHSYGKALCALAQNVLVGVDIERIEPRAPVFVEDYFTPPEIALVERAPVPLRDRLITTIWSAKEAVLKALRLGLTVDTRTVTCLGTVPGPVWQPFTVETTLPNARPMSGWWRTDSDFALTLVAGSQPGGYTSTK